MWFFILFIFQLSAKVEAPNYNFSLDQLAVYYPGKSIDDIKKIHPDMEMVNNKNSIIIYKFYHAHNRYKFPVLIQVENQKVLDMYAKLPSYFLHDVFHQSLINRLGKQETYRLVDEHAIYIWPNKDNLRYVYMGACTITCFPIFLNVSLPKDQWSGDFLPLVDQMEKLINMITP